MKLSRITNFLTIVFAALLLEAVSAMVLYQSIVHAA